MTICRRLPGTAALVVLALLAISDAPPRRTGASASMTAATDHFRRSEYFATRVASGALQAPNRAQGLRTISTRGPRVVPRESTGPSWEWSLSLARYGRAGELQTVAPAEPAPSGNRVEYVRDALTEWYVNDERGLEQGFTLREPPAGEGHLVFELAVGGTLHPERSEDGLEIQFAHEDGSPAIHFGALKTIDAQGLELVTRFAPAEDAQTIRIEVDAEGAAYPIIVDPLATSPTPRIEGNFANAHLGICVAGAGDINGDGYSDVVTGASSYDSGQPNTGQVAVFYGGAAGLSSTAAWTAVDPSPAEGFGAVVATAGDVNGDGCSDLLVGAPQHAGNLGAAYLWYGSPSGLGPNGTPANSDWHVYGNQSHDLLGQSVACAGDVNGDRCSDIVIGAPGHDIGGGVMPGKVLVYAGTPKGVGSLLREILGTVEGQMGYAVATAGDVNFDGYSDVIVGAPTATRTENREGLAYVYYGPSLFDSTRAVLGAGFPAARFGASVSTAGAVANSSYLGVIVGAPGHDAPNDNGAAYVFYGNASGFQAGPVFSVVGDQQIGHLGQSVSTAGDVNGDGFADIVIGWDNYSNGQASEGAALGWYGAPSGLGSGALANADWKIESNVESGALGRSIALAGDVNGDGLSDVVVGAPGYVNGQSQEGAASIYLGGFDRIDTTPTWIQTGTQGGERLGEDVAGVGDLNADGRADIAVGSKSYNNGLASQGLVSVYYGGSGGPASTPSWQATGDIFFAQLGASIDGGDFNGDGFDDLVVGAPGIEAAQNPIAGRVYVWYGSVSGLAGGPLTTVASASWSAESGVDEIQFGASVCSAGDINGDGYCDLVVGAPYYSNGQIYEGGAFVWYGSATGLGPNGLISNADWKAESNLVNSYWGLSVATAGDVNADGYSDILVSSPSHSETLSDQGAAFLWLGSASGLGVNGTSANADWYRRGTAVGQNYAMAAATAGDVNGDGYSDVIVGSPLTGVSGSAFVYRGNAAGLDSIPSSQFFGSGVDSRMGQYVGTAGDLNGDGYSDYFSAAYRYTNGETNEGAIFLYYGGPSGGPVQIIESNLTNAFMGPAAGLGDTNADGFGDFLVGIPFANRAWAWLGGGSPAGQLVVLRQRKALANGILARFDKSDHDRSFKIEHIITSPFGRGRMRPQYQVAASGVTLEGTGLFQPFGYLDQSKIGLGALFGDIQNLESNRAYHWRMRLHYDMTQSPWQPAGRWVAPASHGVNETCLRTASVAPVAVDPRTQSFVQLGGATPNPFCVGTDLAITLPSAMPARVAVYDVRGRLVRELLRSPSLEPGRHIVTWNGLDRTGRAVSSGAYFVRLETGGGQQTRTVVLEK